MHEASLVQGLLDLVLTTVAQANAEKDRPQITQVTEVVCELGLFSCVEPHTLSSCFELFAEDTIARGATLTINTAPLACTCKGCGKTFQATSRRLRCPGCGGDNIHFDGGHGLLLLSLRVETEE